ncbi:orotate phosphoribosyltransferase [Buchnera aphidicola]|uniref:orotate phosphoribosyltransferase n=1 Tax=Buchnera aphidicola TaxID=9 RepID=UPI003BEF37F3
MDYKKKFITLSLRKKALMFGKFKLKSGRISPYFFNSGLLSTGKDILKVGLFYAHLIVNSKINFDLLFGAAYKGIPIVIATSIALSHYYNINIPYSFNRKEKKTHGEKGLFIGKNVKNKKVIILDDVITSGISINHACEIIEKQGGYISSIFVLLDRKEKINKNLYINTYNKKYNINSIITMKDIILYLIERKELKKNIPDLIKYLQKYSIFENKNILI